MVATDANRTITTIHRDNRSHFPTMMNANADALVVNHSGLHCTIKARVDNSTRYPPRSLNYLIEAAGVFIENL